MTVFERLVGQPRVVDELTTAATAARTGDGVSSSAMTHSWLFTGPPGSGRSVAALCFAAALECTNPEVIGCGECPGCLSTLSGTHADVRRVVPEGLSIGVDEMRAITAAASRKPMTGRWQIIVIEDADRLTEGASNALLKSVEEPPEHTVFLLCAPSTAPEDISVTLRSRCRHVPVATPSAQAVAQLLVERDGLDPQAALLAAEISGGHVGRARRLATDPQARARREHALAVAGEVLVPARAYAASERLLREAEAAAKTATTELDERETEELRTALGAGGTGRGTAGAMRGSAGALKALEQRQKSRATRAVRDELDRALIDLAGLYRDALAISLGRADMPYHPDQAHRAGEIARRARPADLLRCVQAVLDARVAIDRNVKPLWALDAMVATLSEVFNQRVSRS